MSSADVATIVLFPSRTRSCAGHRIRLQVSGGAHPRYGRNHGTAEAFGTGTRLQASDRAVLHDAQHPSAVWLPVHG